MSVARSLACCRLPFVCFRSETTRVVQAFRSVVALSQSVSQAINPNTLTQRHMSPANQMRVPAEAATFMFSCVYCNAKGFDFLPIVQHAD